jgi:hypothetical protein
VERAETAGRGSSKPVARPVADKPRTTELRRVALGLLMAAGIMLVAWLLIRKG